jgi:prevent-host-death family protein
MSSYSVAEAKSGLPGLINRAMAGEEVIITRHGKPVAEIRPTAGPSPAPPGAAAFYDWLKARRSTLKEGHAMTSVQLLNLIYDEPAS